MLAKEADRICRENYGDEVYVRGLVEFSNHCSKDCLYCGIRKSNANVSRYRLLSDDIAGIVEEGLKRGFCTFVLQSGEDEYYDVKKLVSLTGRIKEMTGDRAALTLSCGIFTKAQYCELKRAGADRYLLRFETSDSALHEKLRNGISLERRLKALNDLKDMDFEVGSGFMVGLPGETGETRINNALLCKKLELDMVGIGPFIPHQDTPLKDASRQSIDLTLKTTALVRLLLPRANIPATTATGTLDTEGREKALGAGANVIMVNITPTDFKKNYLLYPGKICLDEDGLKCLGCIGKKIEVINKKLVMERGDSKSREKKYAG